MEPKEFVIFANELLKSKCGPPEVRTAISRSYYAAFHVSKNFLKEIGFEIKDGPSGHQEVYSHLNNSGMAEIISAASKLGDLRSRRIDADYRLNKVKIEEEKTAKALVNNANNIINSVDGCSTDMIKQITKSIEDWKSKIQ